MPGVNAAPLRVQAESPQQLWESLGFVSALILAADSSGPATLRKNLHIVNPLRLTSLGTTENCLVNVGCVWMAAPSSTCCPQGQGDL